MKISSLDHVNIEAVDVDASARFYEDVLGLKSGERPPFDRPGHWMYCGDQPIIHIISPLPDNKLLTGSKDAAISHFSMQIEDFDAAKRRLDDCNVEYEETNPPDTELRQLFFPDPDGVLIELLYNPNR